MNTHDCIFCKVIEKQVPAEVIEENDDVIVIRDIAPKAPIHYLIIPKKHIKDLNELDDAKLAGKLLFTAKKLAKGEPFRLVISNGYDAGQRVFHLHIHFLSGKKMLDV